MDLERQEGLTVVGRHEFQHLIVGEEDVGWRGAELGPGFAQFGGASGERWHAIPLLRCIGRRRRR